MELDHIFLVVPGEAQARAMMAAAGLRVNYSRSHPGQGTRNLCACLGNMFFELLWFDGSAIAPETERIGLPARGRGSGSPLGLAWRGYSTLPTEPYAAPFLPDGGALRIASASLDPWLPFVFEAPGGIPPCEWTNGLAGERQLPAFSELGHLEIRLPDPERAASLLGSFSNLTLAIGSPRLSATLLDGNGEEVRSFHWDFPPMPS